MNNKRIKMQSQQLTVESANTSGVDRHSAVRETDRRRRFQSGERKW